MEVETILANLLRSSLESHQGGTEGEDESRSDFDNILRNDEDQRAGKR